MEAGWQRTEIGKLKTEEEKKIAKFILELGSMCNDSNIAKNGEVEGEPTETAIVNAALKLGDSGNNVNRVNEIPFESSRKMMTTIHRFGSKYRIVTKGAPDILIKRCSKVYKNGEIIDLNYSMMEDINSRNVDMACDALRVLGVAYLDVDILPSKIESQTIEKDLIFVGLIGMIDPPRQGVYEAVKVCKKAGIKTVMITGDHILTAKAIATKLGILRGNDKAITGAELDKMSEGILEKQIYNYSVFARVSPEHKVRIVNAFRKSGAVVAMTGDGVNDAPALKNADIGIAMGKTRN